MGNSNEHATINENMATIELNQESMTATKRVDSIQVSPTKVKLRKEVHKHLQKLAPQMIKRAYLKSSSINVGDIV